jgi:uncharacterized membrane protein
LTRAGVEREADQVSSSAACFLAAHAKALGVSLFVLQCFGLSLLSLRQYHRMQLGMDFGIFAQAWTLIGQGHLNPTLSVFGYPYLKSHFELIMWPLALLYPLVRSPIILLWIQDAAISGACLVVYLWSLEAVQREAISRSKGLRLVMLITVLLIINPIPYTAALLDFHFESLATLFAILLARDLWSGKSRRGWVWVALCLLCGDVGGLLVLGVGISGLLASRAARQFGLWFCGIGILWLALITSLGANQGSDVRVGYAYLGGVTLLAPGLHGLLQLGGGVLGHPQRLLHMVAGRFTTIAAYLRSGGLFGILNPWGLGVSLVVLLSSALQANPTFIHMEFQNYPVVPFVTIGTLLFILSLRRLGPGIHRRGLVAGVAAVALGGSIWYSIQNFPYLGSQAATADTPALLTNPAEGAALRATLSRTPPDAAVLTTIAASGRFAQRPEFFVIQDLSPHSVAPLRIRSGTAVFIMDPQEDLTRFPYSEQYAVTSYLVNSLHARVITDSGGVVAFLWHPKVHASKLELP